jgi:hypothetical protein
MQAPDLHFVFGFGLGVALVLLSMLYAYTELVVDPLALLNYVSGYSGLVLSKVRV